MRLLTNHLVITFSIMTIEHFKLYQFANTIEVSRKLFTHIEPIWNNNNNNNNNANNNSYKLNEIFINYKEQQKQLNKNQQNKSSDSSNIVQKSVQRIYPASLNVNNTVAYNNNNIINNNNNSHNSNESKVDDYYNTNNIMHATNEQILRHNTSYDKSSDDVLTDHECNTNTSNNNKKSRSNTNYSRDLTSSTISKYSPIKMHYLHKMVLIGINDTHSYSYAHVHDHYHDNHYNKHKKQRRALNDLLIAPNTRWCGRGNIANNTYKYLGGALAADKCCRKHDHCPVFIPSLNKRFEIFNYRPYTLSHCSCDRRFRTCLKMANDDYAKAIGKIFFNVIQIQCIVLRKEHTCQQRARNGDCIMEHTKQRAYLKKNKKF